MIGIVTTAALGANWGAPLPAAIVGLALVLSLVALSALVIGLSRTEHQAEGIAAIVVFELALLGGNFSFISSAPALMRRLALSTPNGRTPRAVTGLATPGGGLATIVEPVLAIGAFTLIVRAVVALASRAVRGRARSPSRGLRVLRDRTALFFLIVLPIVLIVIVGMSPEAPWASASVCRTTTGHQRAAASSATSRARPVSRSAHQLTAPRSSGRWRARTSTSGSCSRAGAAAPSAPLIRSAWRCSPNRGTAPSRPQPHRSPRRSSARAPGCRRRSSPPATPAGSRRTCDARPARAHHGGDAPALRGGGDRDGHVAARLRVLRARRARPVRLAHRRRRWCGAHRDPAARPPRADVGGADRSPQNHRRRVAQLRRDHPRAAWASGRHRQRRIRRLVG